MKRNKFEISTKGITLIALVVTIVVLLILAGVSISMLGGENGIIKQAQKSKDETTLGEIKEEINVAWGKVYMDKNLENIDIDEQAFRLENILKEKDPNVTVIPNRDDSKLEIIYRDYSTDILTNVITKEGWKHIACGINIGIIGVDMYGDIYSINDVSDKTLILQGQNIKEISSGKSHVIALDYKGKIYAWGNNSYGQLGDGTTEEKTTPICISDDVKNPLSKVKIKTISAKEDYTTAVDESGKVYEWGNILSKRVELMPNCISDEYSRLEEAKIVYISAGRYHITTLDSEGRVYLWGAEYEKDDGHAITYITTVPHIIRDNIENKKIIKISSRDLFTVAVDDEGNVYTWGANIHNELGNGIKEGSKIPICISDKFQELQDGIHISEIFEDDTFSTFAIDDNGKLYGWGGNQSVPKRLDDTIKTKEIAVVQNITVAIDEDGALYINVGPW